MGRETEHKLHYETLQVEFHSVYGHTILPLLNPSFLHGYRLIIENSLRRWQSQNVHELACTREKHESLFDFSLLSPRSLTARILFGTEITTHVAYTYFSSLSVRSYYFKVFPLRRGLFQLLITSSYWWLKLISETIFSSCSLYIPTLTIHSSLGLYGQVAGC